MQEVTITPSEVREAWRTIQEGRSPFRRKHPETLSENGLRVMRGDRVLPWIGASGAQIQERLDHGYEVEGRAVKVAGTSDASIPAMVWDDEEGNLSVDAILAGEDLYRLNWDSETEVKSLKIRACYGMAAGAEASVIGDYMEWVLQVMDKAISEGVLVTMELFLTSINPWTGAPDRVTMTIPLVSPGSTLDVISWRAFMAPGAFRSLGFVALGLASDRLGRTLKKGYGRPGNSGWAVDFKDGVLEVGCPVTATHFPAEMMDALLETAYAAV